MNEAAVRSSSSTPIKAMVPGQVPLRALWWGASASDVIDHPKPVTVLLHGLGDGADMWRPVLEAWPGQIPPMLALDLPGHGGSGRLAPGGYQLEEVARIVAAALRHLRLDRVVLIGHSVGAGVALRLAGREQVRPVGTILIERNPDAVERADAAVSAHVDALIAGAADLDGLTAFVLAQLPLADPRATRLAVAALSRSSGVGRHIPIDAAAKQLLARPSGEPSEWALLGAVGGPVAIVRGQYSSFLPAPVAARMAATTRLPAQLGTIEKAGHAISLERPAALAAALHRHVTPHVGNG